MKQTIFKEKHEALGAKMVSFAGYTMPIQYEGINVEHENVRNKLGMFDVSHMGEFMIEGPKAFELAQRISSNDISTLTDGKVQYNCMPNDKGGIVDDFLIYKFNDQKYLLVVNASNIEKDWDWISLQNKEIGAELKNDSDKISLLAVQGPYALKTVQKLTNEPIEDMEFYSFKTIDLGGMKNIVLSTTGYTGEKGCEIYFYSENGPDIWDEIMEAGKEFGIKPIGLAARDTLRLEMAMCLYGNDIDETTSPIEAGLGWITKFTEGNNFVNRDELFKQKEEGVKRKLIGFEVLEKGIPRKGYKILDENGDTIGNVTSGTMSPTLKKPIGLGYVKTGYHKSGTPIFVEIRNKPVRAEVVKRPFVKKN